MMTHEGTAWLQRAQLRTPAFVIDRQMLQDNARRVRSALGNDTAHLLFAMKSFSVPRGLERLASVVDGFAASSLFEARLARNIVGRGTQTVHFTSPGLPPEDIGPICEVVDYLSFNSLPQWQRHHDVARDRVSAGLRVNPQLGFVEDARYDPCRAHSKLGVPLRQLKHVLQTRPDALRGIEGLHFHSNCDATDLEPLLRTVDHLIAELEPLFEQLRWVNMGGGYLFDDATEVGVLDQLKGRLAQRGNLRIFMEPGAAIARSAGYVVTSVVDVFDSEGKTVAVLDTSINHMPEIFEYQLRPQVLGDSLAGDHAYLLAGAACLAGDLFGEYHFETPLQVGSRIIFPDRGAYSLVKANMFNGINLPTLYEWDEGELMEIKRFAFEDYLMWCGADHAASL